MTPPSAHPPRFHSLPLGAVRPRGWLLAQLRGDLQRGFAGVLDGLTPHAAHDLFLARIGSSDSHLAWWDAETRGNWLWGYVMMAALAELPEHTARSRRLADELLAAQDNDGYIGIYAPGERYRHAPGENGELWAQSRALLVLAAACDAGGAEHLLAAVRRAVDLTQAAYPEQVPYFVRGDRLGRDQLTGLTHGLCFADVLAWLHERTCEPAYAYAAARCYLDFSAMPRPFPNDDLALPNLLDPSHRFGGHAVHTAEHLRALLWAHRAAPEQVSASAVATALARLGQHRLPSGALAGDENIHGTPHPESGYEFCTLAELAFSLSRAVELLGDAACGDWLERLVGNAVQGARLPDGTAIAYLSADTRLAATAARTDAHSAGAPGRRFKYSPTHDDVACCCNPNAVRLLPQYVSRMWLALPRGEGLAVAAYGPCEVRSRVGDVSVRIVEHTGYPFDDGVELELLPERPVPFALLLRRPAWRGSMAVEAPGASQVVQDGWCRLEKRWQPGDRVRIRFAWEIRAEQYANGEAAVLRGPVQFALPVPHRLQPTRDYPLPGFHDYDVLPLDPAAGYRDIPVLEAHRPDLGFGLETTGQAEDYPWGAPRWLLRGRETLLVPIGCTVLRRAALPLSE